MCISVTVKPKAELLREGGTIVIESLILLRVYDTLERKKKDQISKEQAEDTESLPALWSAE